LPRDFFSLNISCLR